MRKLIGEILIERTFASSAVIEDAFRRQGEGDGRKIGEILIAGGHLSFERLGLALAEQAGVMMVAGQDILSRQDPTLLALFPIYLARKYRAIPLFVDDERLVVATVDTDDYFLQNQLYLLYGKDVIPVPADEKKVTELINNAYSRLDTTEGALNEEEFRDMGSDEDAALPDLIDSNDEAPIIRFVNSMVAKAVKERASDIHFESFEDEMIVRFRRDGKLYVIQKVPKAAQAGLITRVKIMARLNIAEKRLPQDGNIKIRVAGNDIDFRVSTLPSVHGESVVLRILDKTTLQLSLDNCGFNQRDLKTMRQMIHKKHGIFLVTGPTGSGKTTTLYSALTEINSPDVKIITEEDPVEYQLKGINQIHINAKIGLSFAAGLRHILRQDPDIIMVGEIRDKETADIAIQASLTGHLVFSTLHTNDAPSAFTRLIDMGVEPFLISSTIIGVLAQRLIRRLCVHCREPYHPDPPILRELGLDPEEYRDHSFYKAVGCDKCAHTGYQGRQGIFELLIIDDDIRRAIVNRQDASVIKKVASVAGMLTLREDGAMKAVKGITSPDEILLRTQEDT
ncbi:MAG TPA: type II secretion system ATPase GspE [bacterium]|nr:type II secretion system ATPase GspE [bacterium]